MDFFLSTSNFRKLHFRQGTLGAAGLGKRWSPLKKTSRIRHGIEVRCDADLKQSRVKREKNIELRRRRWSYQTYLGYDSCLRRRGLIRSMKGVKNI